MKATYINASLSLSPTPHRPAHEFSSANPGKEISPLGDSGNATPRTFAKGAGQWGSAIEWRRPGSRYLHQAYEVQRDACRHARKAGDPGLAVAAEEG